MLLFWYCFDDTLARHFDFPALGEIPFGVWLFVMAGTIAFSRSGR